MKEKTCTICRQGFYAVTDEATCGADCAAIRSQLLRDQARPRFDPARPGPARPGPARPGPARPGLDQAALEYLEGRIKKKGGSTR